MTRGTRGDVQPFVALARGLCSERGWLVTICTEARWKQWVVAQCADITAGAVHFVCSGGDTQRQTETWVSKEARACRMHACTCEAYCAAYTTYAIPVRYTLVSEGPPPHAARRTHPPSSPPPRPPLPPAPRPPAADYELEDRGAAGADARCLRVQLLCVGPRLHAPSQAVAAGSSTNMVSCPASCNPMPPGRHTMPPGCNTTYRSTQCCSL